MDDGSGRINHRWHAVAGRWHAVAGSRRFVIRRKIPAVVLAMMVPGLTMLTACRSAGYERAAEERYEGAVTYVPNAGGSYVLAIEERPAGDSDPLAELRFFVYDTQRDSIAYERPSAFRGSVIWQDDHLIRVEETPGIVRLEDTRPNVYFIDARTGRRVGGGSGGGAAAP